MNITTASPITKLTFNYSLNRPKFMLELNLNLIVVENPHFINALDRSTSHPLNRTYSYLPLLKFNVNFDFSETSTDFFLNKDVVCTLLPLRI